MLYTPSHVVGECPIINFNDRDCPHKIQVAHTNPSASGGKAIITYNGVPITDEISWSHSPTHLVRERPYKIS